MPNSLPLTEALAARGIRHQRSKTIDKHDLFVAETGEHIGCFDAHEAWLWLKQDRGAA